MKKALCILLLFCLLTGLSAVAETLEDEAHRCIDFGPIINGFTWISVSDDENGTRGFIIDPFGNRLSDEPYEISNRYFSDGLVTVWKDGRAGCIDEKGQVVIPFEWNSINDFYHGAAIARRDGQEMLINRSGEILVSYTLQHTFSDGFDETLARTPAADCGLFILHHDDQDTLYRATGEEVVTVDQVEGLSYYYLARLNERKYLNADILLVQDGGKYGYLNNQGEWIIPAQYIEAFPFSDGLAAVLPETGGQYLLIDRQGHTIAELPENCTVKGTYREGKIPVMDAHGRWGYADQNGQLVLPCQWEEAECFFEGRAVVKKDRKYGIIDPSGELITPCKWEWVRLCPDGYAVVKAENNEGVLTQDGQLALPCEYCRLEYLGDGAFSFANHYQVPIYAMSENTVKYGLVHVSGKILSPAQWSSLFQLTGDKYTEVTRRDESGQYKTGYLDHQGHVIIPCEYDDGYFQGGYFILSKNGYLTILDEQGNRTF